MGPLQTREKPRQQVGCEGGDYSELEGSGEELAVPCEIDEIARGGEEALGALSHVDSGRGEHKVARPAFDQIRADLTLQFPDLHGERGLCHGAIVGGASEMPLARERDEIPQLAQGDHRNKIILSPSAGQSD